jgi:hypothetical protein
MLRVAGETSLQSINDLWLLKISGELARDFNFQNKSPKLAPGFFYGTVSWV